MVGSNSSVPVSGDALPAVRRGAREDCQFSSVLLIGAEVLPGKISVKVERPQRSEDVRP